MKAGQIVSLTLMALAVATFFYKANAEARKPIKDRTFRKPINGDLEIDQVTSIKFVESLLGLRDYPENVIIDHKSFDHRRAGYEFFDVLVIPCSRSGSNRTDWLIKFSGRTESYVEYALSSDMSLNATVQLNPSLTEGLYVGSFKTRASAESTLNKWFDNIVFRHETEKRYEMLLSGGYIYDDGRWLKVRDPEVIRILLYKGYVEGDTV
jgi:hypothetical protein